MERNYKKYTLLANPVQLQKQKLRGSFWKAAFGELVTIVPDVKKKDTLKILSSPLRVKPFGRPSSTLGRIALGAYTKTD